MGSGVSGRRGAEPAEAARIATGGELYDLAPCLDPRLRAPDTDERGPGGLLALEERHDMPRPWALGARDQQVVGGRAEDVRRQPEVGTEVGHLQPDPVSLDPSPLPPDQADQPPALYVLDSYAVDGVADGDAG